MAEKVNKTKAVVESARFSKAALNASKKFSDKRDLLSALLDDKKLYTIAEAEDLMEKYLKGKVK